MRTWIRDQSLSLFFLGLFLLTLSGQSVAGWKAFNEEQLQHDSPESKPVGAPHEETGSSG